MPPSRAGRPAGGTAPRSGAARDALRRLARRRATLPEAALVHDADQNATDFEKCQTRIKAPFLLVLATWQALRIVSRLQPGVVLGMGGFASGPGGLVAWMLRIPLLLHEQNSIVGH